MKKRIVVVLTVVFVFVCAFAGCSNTGGGSMSGSGNADVDVYEAADETTIEPDYSQGRVMLALAADWDTSTDTLKYGYINESGEWVIEPKFDHAEQFGDNGLAFVSENYSEGFINGRGELIIDFVDIYGHGDDSIVAERSDSRFMGAQIFSNGLASIKTLHGEWGYIDETGTWVIEPQFYNAGKFADNGLALVWDPSDGSIFCGFIDRTGAWAIPPLFRNEMGQGFADNGLAPIKDGDSGKTGFIDSSGSWVIEPKYFTAWGFADNGLAFVTQTDSFLDGDVESFFIDDQDNVIIDLGEDRSGAWWFSGNGLAPVVTAIDSDVPYAVAMGYIDQSGEWVIEPRFIQASSFGVNGLAPVCDLETKKWGFVNESGEWVIEPRFAGCAAFTEAVA
jgi:hypothetical protein